MGPRIREDNGKGGNARGRLGGEGRFANRPYWGLAERLNVTGDHKEPVSKVSAPLSAVKRCDAKRNHAQ